MRNIKNIVIHCTATQSHTTVEAIQNNWRKPVSQGGNGWKSPGYHYIISANGGVKQLAPESSVTNGVKDHNATSIHLSYIGGVDTDNKTPKDTRTPEQLVAMIKLVKQLRARYPNAKILGHRDFGVPKACPSFDVAEWLKKVGIE